MVVIWLRYECLNSNKHFENCRKWAKNGLSMSEDLDMKNGTFDNGRSLSNFLFSVSLFHVFPSIRQSKKYIGFKLVQDQDLFHARFSIKDGESRIC